MPREKFGGIVLATRIYALAKDLKLDTKELVDLCTRAGIPGKGSALATLTDDEVDRVQTYIGGGGVKAKRGRKAVEEPLPPPEPPRRPVAVGKMPVITPRKKGAPQPPPMAPAPASSEPPQREEPAAPPVSDLAAKADQPQESRPADEAPVAPAPAAQAAPQPQAESPETSRVRKEDYIGPGGYSGKMPVLGDSSGKPSQRKSSPAGPSRARPTVKLAPLPAAEKPKQPKKKAEEPAPQKPDMRLPADAIRASKAGSKPLAAHLRRHERVAEAEKKKREFEKVGEPDTAERRGKRRRGKAEEEEDRPLLGGREQRQLRRRQTGPREDGEEPQPQQQRPIRRITRRNRRTGLNTAAPRKDRITLQLPCTIREFSEAAGVPAAQILGILLSEGIATKITAQLDAELAEFLAAELGADVEFRQPVSLEDELLALVEHGADAEEDLQPRAPVITFLGHVDHGKTSLLDKIIGTDVVSGESGGITQHIRAYQVDHAGRKIAFVDTPGHEAFTEMRARGANVTDIAVLVVAADDGVMPQTEEAISHARAAGVPIVVALNKIDLPGVDQTRTLQQLATNDLLPSEWGGDVEVIRTSAITGDGIEDLLETLLTVAELHEYRANPNRPAYGTSLEAQQEPGRGVIAKVIVQNGTLHVGDILVCGEAYGKVKALFDTLQPNRRVDEAGPSTAVNVTGLDVAPKAGEHFYVLDDIAQAREIAEVRSVNERREQLTGGVQHVTLETLFDRLEGAEEIQTLNIILRADVRGSIEAIEKELGKLQHPEVKIKLLQKSVGGVTEGDVMLAHASDAIIIGFNVVPDENARQLAEEKKVQIRRYEVIYKITDDLKAALEGLLRPEQREVDLGRALVQQTFKISRLGTIAGCRVLNGTIERNGRARVIRENTIIGDYPIDTLRREKDDAREVREGLECGIKLSGFNDIKEGDLLEVYKVESVGRKFEDAVLAT